MTYCTHCGAAISEGQRFCNQCGAPLGAPAGDPSPANPQEVLQIAKRNMNWERKAWRITGFVFIGIMIFYCLYMLLFLGGGGLLISSLGDSSGGRTLSVMGIVYGLLLPLLYLPVVIVCFHMNRILTEYAAEPDNRRTLDHIGSVGNIVFCAFFSLPALVFTIINFVYYKQNRAALEACRSLGYYNY